ncbi:MAG TPA: putative PEP-binding protein, partial [Streptosporangiaceae bacterium]|nr:putative PEP-binding protein [Streptosporangiaceae bacterium]
IAGAAEFFSFGTNDLTQMTWGFSRDDVEASFFGKYIEKGIFGVSPFETLDRDGVGRLITIAAAEGRATRPGLQLGICGEHGGDPKPEIMVPLVGAVQELEAAREEIERVLAEVAAETGTSVHTLIGTMIEVPRAALTAGQIASAAQFFSFGTNDLTQMGWGFSRDDVEGAFFSRYIELGIFGVSPFETIDTEGVGRMIRIAVQEGRAARPGLELGVCGEHGGDPDSVHFFHQVGLNYVSCSPFRVPVARLEAGRAVVLESAGGSDSR